ncbi:MAG TPA: hypothetical protein VF693_06935 [Allosphingosinicella sp.]
MRPTRWRANRAAAPAPNSRIIGGAGTGVPPVEPEVPPLELALDALLALDAEEALVAELPLLAEVPPKLLEPLEADEAEEADEALLAELPEAPVLPWLELPRLELP